DALDFAKMYDASLSHHKSGSLWGGNHQSAKSAMLIFITNNREFVRSMFRDLFSEQKDLIMRIERFQFHCDQLLEEVRKRNKKINHHHHHDFYMPTLYLSMRYPLRYCPYERENFSVILRELEVKDVNYVTLDRFLKVTNICQSQLMQEPEIPKLLRSKIHLDHSELYESKFLSYEFFQFVSRISP
ncbi:MAG: hypothetical protein HKN76_14050, partial [Saprospiraceae bacterium]|nr:hypothetical protein [Saprospiraceae bacterium]